MGMVYAFVKVLRTDPLEPAAEPAQFGGYGLCGCQRVATWNPLEPAGTRGGTRAFLRTLYAELKMQVARRDLFILLH